jgi:glycosyltransferase involved in cell wall biosynthesis
LKVSVLMAVYNAEATIAMAVESILLQSYTNLEFIIIDDGCSDKTIEIINEFEDDRINVIQNPENMGQIRSLNRGIGYCTGRFIARMDADDISLPNRFELQIGAFNADDELAVVSTNGYKMFLDGSLVKLMVTPVNSDALKILSMYKSPLHHISVMIKKEFLLADFQYDEKIMISTDWDLWSRYLKAGLKIKVLRQRCFKIFILDTSYSTVNKKVRIAEDLAIIKRNVEHFTGLELSEKEAIDVRDLHYPESIETKTYFAKVLLWLKILIKYRSDSKINKLGMIAFELCVLGAKYLRLIKRNHSK